MDTTIILILIVGLAIIVWGLAVADLMGRKESEFSSPSDRLCWTILLAITGILGAIIWLWKRPRYELAMAWPISDAGPQEADDPLTCMNCGAPIAADAQSCAECHWSYAES